MWCNVKRLFGKLWNDDCGALLATEYLALGSVVVLGSLGGLVSMRDAYVGEMQEYGNSVRAVRQNYTPANLRQYSSASNYTGGSQAVCHGDHCVAP